ncbi:MAG: helix-turn-helix domain-containing protein [Bacteroidota bacterium]
MSRDSLVSYCDELIASKDVSKNIFGLAAKAHHEYTLQSDFDSADVLFEKSLSKLASIDEVHPEVKSYVLHFQSLRYISSHELETAINILFEATKICNEKCSFLLESKLQSTLARAYSLSGKVFKALEISHLCLSKIKNSPDFTNSNHLKKEYVRELVRAANRSMNVFYYLDRETYKSYLDSTQHYITMAKTAAEKYKISGYARGITLTNADIHFYKHDYKTAQQYWKKAIKTYKKIKYKKRIAQISFRIAECDFFLENFDKAAIVFQQQLQDHTWKEFQLLNNEALCNFYLFKIYKLREKSEEAMAYADQYGIKIKEYLEAKNESFTAVNTIIAHEEKKKEIEAYVKNFESQKRQKKMYLYSLLAAIVCIGVLASYFMYSRRKNKRNIRLLHTRITKLEQAVAKQNLPKSSNSITDANAAKLIEKLKKLEKQQLFLQPNYTLALVAKKLNTNSSYLSQTVNHYLHVTFAQYSNTLRIHSIVQRLKEHKSLRSYTIEALAREAGYKSIGSFNTNFKKLLKVKPSEYLKELERTEKE